MQIDLTTEQFERLNSVAAAAGYVDAVGLVHAIADEPTADPRGELTEADLAESVAMIERGNEEIAQGGGIDGAEAFQRLAAKRGFSLE